MAGVMPDYRHRALPVVTVDPSVASNRDLITLIYLFAIARFSIIAGPIPAARSPRSAPAVKFTLGVLVEPILPLAPWVVPRRWRVQLISAISPTPFITGLSRAVFKADSGAVRLRLRHLYRNGQAAVRLGGSGAGVAKGR